MNLNALTMCALTFNPILENRMILPEKMSIIGPFRRETS